MSNASLRESTNILAKLLAIEGIYVQHDPNAPTASFDLKKRIITMPMMKKMEGYHYNALVAHEVGHAVFSPYKKYKQLAEETHPVICNVVEDARIEKLIQRRYPGLKKDFYLFYKDISDISSENKDFFGLSKVINGDINLTLIDKLNLHFKVGKFYKVDFSQEESQFIPRMEAMETWEDCEPVIRDIFDWMKQKDQIKEVLSEESEQFEGDPDGDSSQSSSAKQSKESKESSNGNKAKSRVKKSLHENGKEDSKYKTGEGYTEVGSTLEEVDSNICKNIYEDNVSSGVSFGDIKQNVDVKNYIDTSFYDKDITEVSPASYKTYMSEITQIINMMASQFNMMKSAKRLLKSTTAQTGILNPKKLHMYKTSDNIFKRSTTVYDDKNHGFVMLLDWSGSMKEHCFSTFKQQLILMEFCRKIKIPFEVYGFTTINDNFGETTTREVFSQTNAKLIKLFDNKMNNARFHAKAGEMFAILEKDKPNDIFPMQGTPLNLVAFLTEHIVNNFQQKNKCEKTVVCLLSDGAPTDTIMVGTRYCGWERVVMRDKANYRNYTIEDSQSGYQTIFNYVKNKCNLTSIMGFFLTNNLREDEIRLIQPNIDGQKIGEAMSSFSENKFVTFENNGKFDNYFAISTDNFDVMKRTTLHDKVKSMVFLREFIKKIA